MAERRYFTGSEKYGFYCPGGENVDISQVVKCESYANGEIMDIMMGEEVPIVKSEPVVKATATAKKEHIERYEQEEKGCRLVF